jgi:hypothetical protein
VEGCLNEPIGLALEQPNEQFILAANGNDTNLCEFSGVPS